MPQQIDVPGMGVVEFPDGMNDADITAAIKKNAPAPVSTPVDMAKSAGAGVAKGLIGLAGLPGDIRKLGDAAGPAAVGWVARKLGLSDEQAAQFQQGTKNALSQKPSVLPTSEEIKTGAVEPVTGEFYKPQTTAGKYAQTVGEFAPGIMGGGGGLIQRGITQVALPGIASEAAGQATEGTKLEPYARVAAAIAGGVAPSVALRAVTPAPASEARQRLVDILNQEGVTSLTAGQRTGSNALRYAENVLGDSMGAGGQASRVTREGQEQFTQAAMRRAGGGENAGPEVLAQNNARLGNEFETLAARNTLQMDPRFGNELGAALRTYDRVPNSQQRAIVQGYADDIIAHAQNNGTMPGPFYQEMRSRLSRQSNGLRQSDPTLSETLRDMRDALDGAMSRSISPADREAWQTARREYGAQKTIEKAASRAGEATAEGQVVPANLRNAVATGNNRGAYARGEGDFSELARAGSAIMAPMPQSGTAPRAAIHTIASLLGAGAGTVGGVGAGSAIGAAAGAVAGPAAAGRILMSAPVQGYLGNQVATNTMRNLTPGQAAIVNALMATEQQRLAPPQQ